MSEGEFSFRVETIEVDQRPLHRVVIETPDGALTFVCDVELLREIRDELNHSLGDGFSRTRGLGDKPCR